MEVFLREAFLFLGLRGDIVLLIFVVSHLFPILGGNHLSLGFEQFHFRAQHCGFDALGLIVGLLVGTLNLLDHRFVGVIARKQRAYGSKARE